MLLSSLSIRSLMLPSVHISVGLIINVDVITGGTGGCAVAQAANARAKPAKTTTLSNEGKRKLNCPLPEGAGIALINLGILPLPNTTIIITAKIAVTISPAP